MRRLRGLLERRIAVWIFLIETFFCFDDHFFRDVAPVERRVGVLFQRFVDVFKDGQPSVRREGAFGAVVGEGVLTVFRRRNVDATARFEKEFLRDRRNGLRGVGRRRLRRSGFRGNLEFGGVGRFQRGQVGVAAVRQEDEQARRLLSERASRVAAEEARFVCAVGLEELEGVSAGVGLVAGVPGEVKNDDVVRFDREVFERDFDFVGGRVVEVDEVKSFARNVFREKLANVFNVAENGVLGGRGGEARRIADGYQVERLRLRGRCERATDGDGGEPGQKRFFHNASRTVVDEHG